MKITSAVLIILFSMFFAAGRAAAAYPFISDVPNLQLQMNASSDVIRFQVSDVETPADQLAVTYHTDNPELVPSDNAHIKLGGSGEDRTLVITPARGKTGIAIITLTVTDTDGDKNRDSLEVEVSK